MPTKRAMKWLTMVASSAVMFGFAGCIDDVLFTVAPFIL